MLSALCDLGYVNEKISWIFIERLLEETLPDVVMSMGMFEFIMHIQVCCYKILQKIKK